MRRGEQEKEATKEHFESLEGLICRAKEGWKKGETERQRGRECARVRDRKKRWTHMFYS
jgi:hypothetical protein